jgi:hypothetical protein
MATKPPNCAVLISAHSTPAVSMRQTPMDTRKLRIVKPPLPAIGVCEGCNSQFKTNKRSEDEVEICLGCIATQAFFADDGVSRLRCPSKVAPKAVFDL